MKKKNIYFGYNKYDKFYYGVTMKNKKVEIMYHRNKDYHQCEIYKLLKFPSKALINEIGNEYNIYFSKEINEKELPAFGRYQKRETGRAVWFFEDNIKYIKPWLESIGKI